MLNQVVLVGRLVKNVKVYKADSGKKVTTVTLAIPRSYKNSEGVYETDFVDCVLWTGIAENTTEYCKKGDIIGIRGRAQSEDGKIVIIADKVTFLSSKKDDKDE